VDDDYVEAVLTAVEQVPPGRVTTDGAIAAFVGTGGPRQVGRTMALHGGGVPWWRVVRADGTLPDFKDPRRHEEYLAEGTPMRPSGAVDMRAAFWDPAEDAAGLHRIEARRDN
jgi:alkylated DNA nucleotide flippase Atl1